MQEASPVDISNGPLRKTSFSIAENIAWSFFKTQGYKDIHVAAIMGNLRQEHNFKTSDVSSGLGIAQWLHSRRSNLMKRDNYTSLEVQLQFISDELASTENSAYMALMSTNTIEDATIAFQNKYERCDPKACMQAQRIAYAYEYFKNR